MNQIQWNIHDRAYTFLLNCPFNEGLMRDLSADINDHEVRKSMYPGLHKYFAEIKTHKFLNKKAKIELETKLKESTMKLIQTTRADLGLVQQSAASLQFAKKPAPVLKTKEVEQTTEKMVPESLLLKAEAEKRSLKTELSQTKSNHRKEMFFKDSIIESKNEELSQSHKVINQLLSNNIKTVQSFGVSVTAESLGL